MPAIAGELIVTASEESSAVKLKSIDALVDYFIEAGKKASRSIGTRALAR